MRYRKLRIAWSVAWGTCCLLLVAFWIRSFSYWDDCWLKLTNAEYAAISCEGRMVVWFENGYLKQRFELKIDPAAVHRSPGKYERHAWIHLYVSPSGNTWFFTTAHCVCVMLTATFAAVSWFPRRFSLRALLTALTAVALLIGALTWADSLY
jgi:hypothetical protein